MKSYLPSPRTVRKLGRDVLVIGIPAAALWITGHAVDIQGLGISAETTAKIVGYAGATLTGYRWWRDFRGTGPTV